MVTMAQALIKKPVQTMDSGGDGWNPEPTVFSGQGGLQGWNRASNFNNFMNNSIPGYAMQGLMPGGLGLGLAARANNSYANNAYTNAMNSRENAIIPQALQPVRNPQIYSPVNSKPRIIKAYPVNASGGDSGGDGYGDYGTGGMGDQSMGSFGGLDGY
jgi:hypothetical protein